MLVLVMPQPCTSAPPATMPSTDAPASELPWPASTSCLNGQPPIMMDVTPTSAMPRKLQPYARWEPGWPSKPGLNWPSSQLAPNANISIETSPESRLLSPDTMKLPMLPVTQKRDRCASAPLTRPAPTDI